MSVAEAKLFGLPNMTAPLRRVLVRAPRPDDLRFWREYGWRSEPDAAAIAREHEGLCGLLADIGVSGANFLVADSGAVLLHPGKTGRRGEAEALGADLAAAGVPVAGRLSEPALAEGGDVIRLDERTLLVGLGYRTNAAGAAELGRLTGLAVVPFDLPHWHGDAEVMHLLSLLSPLADDLVVAYPPLLPTRLAQLLAERSVEIVPVPDEEFETMGGNVLALAPRRALVVSGNPETRRRLEGAGVEVMAYEGSELSKGDGGPTCLTCPILRA